MNHSTLGKWMIVSCLLTVVWPGRTNAQDASDIIVFVTSVYEESIFLDKGSAEGLKKGDLVRMVARDGHAIEATIRSLSSHSARCVMEPGEQDVLVGMFGLVTHLDPIPKNSTGVPLLGEALALSTTEQSAIAPVAFEAAGAGAIVRVPVRVAATAGAGLYLNKGRAAGLEPGDEVVIFSPAEGNVPVVVLSVSRNSARCSAATNMHLINIDTPGEALVPGDRFNNVEEIDTPPKRKITEHPPWTQPQKNWDPNQPLLAPAYSRTPQERDSTLNGRLFGHYMHTWNDNARSNQYSLGRLGADLRYQNPFRYGGRMRVRGEFNRRGIFLEDYADRVNDPGWINRLSYRWGGTDDQPYEVEMGRFYPQGLPAFGILDGAALSYRTERGNRIAATFGFLPEMYPNLELRNDPQIGLFYKWNANPEETLTSGIGFQKTWHKGTPDRDLFIHTVDYNPNEVISIHSFLWGDYYDSHDNLKTTSFEITEAVFQPMVRFDPGHGIGAHISYVRWPQLLRMEYNPFVSTQILNSRVFRYGIFSWQQLSERIRLNGRVDQWDDERSSNGTSWECKVSFRDIFYADGEVSFAVFGTDGLYSTGPGGRILLSRHYPWCFASLWYELADYKLFLHADQPLSGNSPMGIFQQYLRANLDFSWGLDKSISVFGDYRFGQNQEAFQIGVFLQKRLL